MNFLNNRHPIIKFTIEKQINNSIAKYHTWNISQINLYRTFTSFLYKISLIKCLIDNWNFCHNDAKNIKSNLIKNAYPPFSIDKVIKKYFHYKFSSNQNQLKDNFDVHYFKLPYIGNLSHHFKVKLSKLSKELCKENFNINLVFDSFKVKNYFSCKDPILNDLKSVPVSKFTCTSCSSSYIGKTCHHFKTRTEKHIKKDNKSQIFKHLLSIATCFDSYNSLCFKIIDKANSKFDLN